MKALFFSPAALGDMIVSAGIVRYLLNTYDEIHIPVNQGFLKTIMSMFRDEERVKIFYYNPNFDLNVYVRENNLVVIRSPYDKLFAINYNSVNCGIMWDEQFYTIFDVPYSKRYTTFNSNGTKKSLELKEKLINNDRYILVHQNYFAYNGDVPIDMHYWRENAKLDSLDKFQIIKINPSLSDDMMDYVDLIRGAEEIHCIASSFFHIVDSMTQETNAKLFFHDIRRTAVLRINNNWNNYKWNFINYSEKL
jgi:hypothetical protein